MTEEQYIDALHRLNRQQLWLFVVPFIGLAVAVVGVVALFAWSREWLFLALMVGASALINGHRYVNDRMWAKYQRLKAARESTLPSIVSPSSSLDGGAQG